MNIYLHVSYIKLSMSYSFVLKDSVMGFGGKPHYSFLDIRTRPLQIVIRRRLEALKSVYFKKQCFIKVNAEYT